MPVPNAPGATAIRLILQQLTATCPAAVVAAGTRHNQICRFHPTLRWYNELIGHAVVQLQYASAERHAAGVSTYLVQRGAWVQGCTRQIASWNGNASSRLQLGFNIQRWLSHG